MSIASGELAHASTEQIIREIQHDLYGVMLRADGTSDVGVANYFAGDNPTVNIERSPEGATVRIDSHPVGISKNATSLVAYYEQVGDELHPLPVDDDRCLRVIADGIHHIVRRWPDTGMSFEPELVGSSLDHEQVKKAAVLAGAVAAAPLIKVGSIYH